MTKASHDSEVPAHGKQVFTACAFIHQNVDGVDKLFMAKRADTKKFLPGVFEIPGGHIDFGENMKAGLAREVREELNMDVTIADPFSVFTYTNPIKGSHSIQVTYFATFTSAIDDITLNPEDHSEYGWYSLKELPQVYTENKGADDIEILQICRGFDILSGAPLKTK